MHTEITRRVGAGWMVHRLDKCEEIQSSRRNVRQKDVSGTEGECLHNSCQASNGAEAWATTKRREQLIEVNEVKMLLWMCGVTLKDNIRTENVRGTNPKRPRTDD